MTSTSYTSADLLESILIDNWTSDNAPNIQKAWERRSVGFIDDRRDQIILTPKAENIKYFGLYGNDHWHDVTIDLDIRTYQNDERHADVVSEIVRIIKSKIRGGTDYTDLRVISSYTRNQYMRNMFNHIITISMRISLSS